MKETTTQVYCDFCNKPCTPVKKIEIPVNYNREYVNKLILHIDTLIYYSVSNSHDVCQLCINNALTKYLNLYNPLSENKNERNNNSSIL